MSFQDPIAAALAQLPKFYRSAIVITGAILIHLSLGSYHTFGNILPYMASYMKANTDVTVDIEDLVWIPTLQGSFPFAMIVGGYLSHRIGPRACALLGCALMSGGVALSSITISYSYAAFLLTYGIMFGVGLGIAYVTAIAAVMNWIPERIGLASGLVVAGFGLSTFFFAPLQTHLVNPWNFAPNKQGYFTQSELLERVPGLFLKLGIIYAIMQIIGLVVICNPPIASRDQADRVALLEDLGEVDDYDDEQTSSTRVMLKSQTFYWLFVSMLCCSGYGNFLYALYKTYGQTFIEDDMYLALTGSTASLANALARIGWGIMIDVTNYQVAMAAATCAATALLLTFPLVVFSTKFAFSAWVIMLWMCMASTQSLFFAALVRCFGTRHKATNYGILVLSTSVSGVIVSLGCQFVLRMVGYQVLFLIVASFPFIAFLLTVSIHVTPHGRRVS